MVRGGRLAAVRLPARGLGRIPCGRERVDPRRDRHGQDAGGMGRSVAGMAGLARGRHRRRIRSRPVGSRAASDRARAPRTLDHAAARARRRHRALPAGSDGVVRHSLVAGDAHVGHDRRGPGEAAGPPAHGTHHDAGEPHPAAHARRARGAVPLAAARGGGRMARADGDEARRADGIGPGPVARRLPGAAHVGAVGDDRQPR